VSYIPHSRVCKWPMCGSHEYGPHLRAVHVLTVPVQRLNTFPTSSESLKKNENALHGYEPARSRAARECQDIRVKDCHSALLAAIWALPVSRTRTRQGREARWSIFSRFKKGPDMMASPPRVRHCTVLSGFALQYGAGGTIKDPSMGLMTSNKGV